MIDEHIQVTLRKIDPLTGKEQWSVPFPRWQRPYRCEAYKDRIVVFLYSTSDFGNGAVNEMVFLDSQKGRAAAPFDTRSFVHKDDDPLITRSRGGSQGSVLDERAELLLPNGWVSHGVSRLPWWNAGTNQIYFFDRYHWELQWSMTLPEGAYNLVNWSNVLVYYKWDRKGTNYLGTLYGQKAGNNVPAWKFTLPADVPDEVVPPAFDAPGPPGVSREFSYAVGEQAIFACGGGALFALEPGTGKILWRYSFANDPVLKTSSFNLNRADILELNDDLVLISGETLARFNKTSRLISAVLRKDIYYNPAPIVCGGFIYCFTQQPR